MQKLFMPVTLAALMMLPLAGAAAAQAVSDIPEGGYLISDNIEALPAPVRDKRDQLIAAAESGDIAQLKLIFDAELAPPTVSFGAPDDPIAHLKAESGDGEGIEILAILRNVLAAPYAAMDGGDGDPIYIWPYFAAMGDLSTLTPGQLVDAYRITGHQKFQQQLAFGGWIYWRVSMTVRGELQAFVAGD